VSSAVSLGSTGTGGSGRSAGSLGWLDSPGWLDSLGFVDSRGSTGTGGSGRSDREVHPDGATGIDAHRGRLQPDPLSAQPAGLCRSAAGGADRLNNLVRAAALSSGGKMAQRESLRSRYEF